MDREAMQDDLAVLVLTQSYLVEVFQVLGRMVFIEQIIPAIVINLKVANINRILVRRSFLDAIENVSECTGYDAAVGVALSAACNSEGLTGARLAICEDCAVVAIEGAVDDVLR